ncbi:MAG: ribosome maturation factor RimP [Candidatus Omnitrophica bacterium]|nr:ribosome maturation factor RimP [Candidatus Omnitrophota bacterium]
MDKHEIESRLREIVSNYLAGQNLFLVDLSYQYRRKDSTLRILVDKAEGGVTLNKCASLNNEIAQILDEENIIEDAYTLEVASPGLDRPLLNLDDFRRCIKKKIKVFFKQPEQGKWEARGVISCVEQNLLIMETEKGVLETPWDNISKAKLEF